MRISMAFAHLQSPYLDVLGSLNIKKFGLILEIFIQLILK